jgi:hypothetical protein
MRNQIGGFLTVIGVWLPMIGAIGAYDLDQATGRFRVIGHRLHFIQQSAAYFPALGLPVADTRLV